MHCAADSGRHQTAGRSTRLISLDLRQLGRDPLSGFGVVAQVLGAIKEPKSP
jgi:hypothetical protein